MKCPDPDTPPAWRPIAEAPEHVQDAAEVIRENPRRGIGRVRLYHGPGVSLYAVDGGERWFRLPDMVVT